MMTVFPFQINSLPGFGNHHFGVFLSSLNSGDTEGQKASAAGSLKSSLGVFVSFDVLSRPWSELSQSGDTIDALLATAIMQSLSLKTICLLMTKEVNRSTKFAVLCIANVVGSQFEIQYEAEITHQSCSKASTCPLERRLRHRRQR